MTLTVRNTADMTKADAAPTETDDTNTTGRPAAELAVGGGGVMYVLFGIPVNKGLVTIITSASTKLFTSVHA